ncbi:MAG: ATP-binding cassette domain-containing protein [Candidatus Hydrogenedens sp.]|nr:ATP-binding cassette domain-containing protein [Candidatus Hydrogenedens sp.]
MSGAILEAKGLSKWFGEIVALNNVELEIAPGVTGLLGPNGAGKSTFMKLALGLYQPSRGYVRVLGESPRNNPRILERIGYCPEIDHFYENMTGFEFVYHMNRHWGMGRKDATAAAERAIERVQLRERMDDPIDEYSKGMRQRIKIAQALACEADLLLLDEPMTGLDPQGREEMFHLVRTLGDEGYSVIISSHILYEVERVTDNVVLIYGGAVLASGRVAEIRDLLDDHPRTIRIDTPEVRALAALFAGDDHVLSLECGEEKLTLRTRDASAAFDRLNRLALDADAPRITGITCSDDDLQSVFDYLVG